MDLTPHIQALRDDLVRAADLGQKDVQAAAEQLLFALEPATRLALMSALSQAAAEISGLLEDRAVEVRLHGRDLAFVVSQGPAASAPEPAGAEDDGDAVARITLRIPEALKARGEVLAAARGQSLNTWLVGAARAAAETPDAPHGPGAPGRNRASRNRVQGWAR